MRKYYFCGYALNIRSTWKDVRWSYWADRINLWGHPPIRNTNERSDQLTNQHARRKFPIVRVVSILEGSRETKGIILVRGDVDKYAGFLIETPGIYVWRRLWKNVLVWSLVLSRHMRNLCNILAISYIQVVQSDRALALSLHTNSTSSRICLPLTLRSARQYDGHLTTFNPKYGQE